MSEVSEGALQAKVISSACFEALAVPSAPTYTQRPTTEENLRCVAATDCALEEAATDNCIPESPNYSALEGSKKYAHTGSSNPQVLCVVQNVDSVKGGGHGQIVKTISFNLQEGSGLIFSEILERMSVKCFIFHPFTYSQRQQNVYPMGSTLRTCCNRQYLKPYIAFLFNLNYRGKGCLHLIYWGDTYFENLQI